MSIESAQLILQRAERILGTVLGIVFIAAGLGKIFVLGQFAGTISGVTHLSPDASTTLAVVLTAIEILGGVALVARLAVVPVSAMFCLLIAVFLWVLSTAVTQGREIQCHCFGLLNIALSNRSEIILDIVLFNLAALLGGLSSLKGRTPTQRMAWVLAGSAVGLFYFQYSAFATIIGEDRILRAFDIQPVMSHLAIRDPEFARYTAGNRVLFLLHFPDFNCPPCFDSFVMASQMVQTYFAEEQTSRALAVFKPGDIADPNDPSRLAGWAGANELGFPVLIAPDSIFQNLKFQKSSILVLSPSGRILLSETLPVNPQRIQFLSQLLKDRYGSRP